MRSMSCKWCASLTTVGQCALQFSDLIPAETLKPISSTYLLNNILQPDWIWRK